MKVAFQNVIWVLIFTAYNYLSLAEDDLTITVGAFFKEPRTQAEVALHSAFYTSKGVSYDTEIQMISDDDAFESISILCDLMAKKGINGIFGPPTYKTASIIESIGLETQIPVIETSWRSTADYFSEDSTLINFFPDQKLFFQGLGVIVDNLQWRTFVVLYEKPENMIKLQDVLKLQRYDSSSKYNSIVFKELGTGPDYRPVLKQIQNSTEFRVLIDCETEHLYEIMIQSKELGLLDKYQIFITSLDAHTVNFDVVQPTANITTIRIIDPEREDFERTLRKWEQYANFFDLDMDWTPYSIKTETALMYDGASLFIDAVNFLHANQNIKPQAMNCYKEHQKWADGLKIANFMKGGFNGVSGPVEFDSFGRRTDFVIYMVDGHRDDVIATWSPHNPEKLIFSKSETERNLALQKKGGERVWIIASIIGAPYLMDKKPENDSQVLEGNDRYEGFSLDLIQELADRMNFTFEFQVLPSPDRGSFNPVTNTWDGLIREVLDRRADLAICDLTITPARREVVDFSTPFMSLGISILYKKAPEKEANMYAFLNVFSTDVWIYSATLYLAMTVVIYFVNRMCPTDWENPHPCEQNPEEFENIWDLKNCLWLTLGGILNQGCDLLPKGLSSRMVTCMWWFFAVIVTNSYIANLASFLVGNRRDNSINNAEDLAMQTAIKYGTLNKGSTQAFFRDSNYSVYQRMWTSMEQSKPTVFEQTNADGVTRVQKAKNRGYAFLMESSTLEYEIETKCDLEQVGLWLDSKGYGIAMPLDYPFRSRINEEILNLQDKGVINKIKNRWWKEKRGTATCTVEEELEDENKLALKNVGGVFLLLGVGLGLAYLTAIGEFLWNVRNVSVEEHISFWLALKAELLVVLKFWIWRKKAKPKISASSTGSRSGSESRSIAHSILHGAESFLRLNVLSKSGTPGSNDHGD